MDNEIKKYYLEAYLSCNSLTEQGEREVKIILSRAGWFPERKIETKEMEEVLIKNGYEIFPTVKLFLQEFGMLAFRKSRVVRDIECHDYHNTNIISGMIHFDMFSGRQQIEAYIKEKITPVGTIYTNELGLFISESGKVFSETHKLGNTFMEAWQNILIY